MKQRPICTQCMKKPAAINYYKNSVPFYRSRCDRCVRKNKKTKNKDIDKKIVRSVNKNIRSSTRKLKPILKSIVGKKVNIVIRDLSFSDKRISKDVKKTISSAVSNAENNFQYDIDNLIVKEAYCGKQIVMKRFRARAKGKASPIIKPYSNLTIILAEKMKEERHGTKG